MIGTDGKVWLNNNLGAKVSDLNSLSTFNPLKQADEDKSIDNYGSLFQWGRDSDGHELINWYIENGSIKAAWVYRTNVWYNRSGVSMNDFVEPCPEGFVTPSGQDWNKLVDHLGFRTTRDMGGYYITPTPTLNNNQYYYTNPPYILNFNGYGGGGYWLKSLNPEMSTNYASGKKDPAYGGISRVYGFEFDYELGKWENRGGSPDHAKPIRCQAR